MTSLEKIKACQTALGELVADGLWGPKSAARLAAVISEAAALHPVDGPDVWHKVFATSFADAADVAAFKVCKAHGGSDNFCFSKGDNGKGYWDDDTTQNIPMCALPPEVWKPLGTKAHGAVVVVTRTNSKGVTFTVHCRLMDTMPHLAEIKNGAGLDLNEAAWKALDQTPPVTLPVSWRWAAPGEA